VVWNRQREIDHRADNGTIVCRGDHDVLHRLDLQRDQFSLHPKAPEPTLDD
jgi:hypothetical protein